MTQASSTAKSIAVLMGGFSRERSVSLSSASGCIDALRSAGYHVTPIDVRDDIPALIDTLKSLNPDAVFNALHGQFGEDGQVQKILNDLQIPYTHSGVSASKTAMDKGKTQALFKSHNLPVANSHVATQNDIRSHKNLMSMPFVVKAVCEGSSIGIAIVKTESDYQALHNWDYGDALIEQYIDGRELTCTAMDHKALAVTELQTKGEFYDFDAKYSSDSALSAIHICPAKISTELQDTIMDLAVRCHTILGCRGISRTDFLWDESSDKLVILETNTQPGMTPTSLSPEQAQVAGYAFADFLSLLVENAQCD